MSNFYTAKVLTYFSKVVNKNCKKNYHDNDIRDSESHSSNPPLYEKYESGKHDFIVGLVGLGTAHLAVKHFYSISLIEFFQIFFVPETLTIKYSELLMLVGFLIWIFASFFIYGVVTIAKSYMGSIKIKVLLTLISIMLMFALPVSAYIKWSSYYSASSNVLWNLRLSFLAYMFVYFCIFRIRIFLDI